MSGKKPPEMRMGAVARGMEGTTVGEGEINLTGELLKRATKQFCERTVRLQKCRPKPAPKIDADKIKRVLEMGLDVRGEMEMLAVSRSTINGYRKRYGTKKNRP